MLQYRCCPECRKILSGLVVKCPTCSVPARHFVKA